MTVLACTSGDGSEKRPLGVTDKSHKPRSFLGKTDIDFPFVNYENTNGWMDEKPHI